MSTLRLTLKMKTALEQLYETNGQSDYVVYSTALALLARELVSMPKIPGQRTAGGQFPEYKVTLTTAGRKWCERHFANIRARSVS